MSKSSSGRSPGLNGVACFTAEICSICRDDLASDLAVIPCGHVFHSECVREHVKMNAAPLTASDYARGLKTTSLKCPNCRLPFDRRNIVNAHLTLERVGEAAARAAAAALLESASSNISLYAPTQRELKKAKEELEAERAAAREAARKAEEAGQRAAEAEARADAEMESRLRATVLVDAAKRECDAAKRESMLARDRLHSELEASKRLRDTQAANAYITTGDLSALRSAATRRTGEQDWQLFVGAMLEREKRLNEVAATAETAAKAADAAAAARGAALERTSRDLVRLERLAASQDAQKKVLERGCSGLRRQIRLLSDAARAAGVDVDALVRAASEKGKPSVDVAAASAADEAKKRLKSRFGSLPAAKLGVGAVEESWGAQRPSEPAPGKQRGIEGGEMAEIDDEAVEEVEDEVHAASSSAAPRAAAVLASEIPLLGGGTVNPFRRVFSESAVAGSGNLRSFAALSPPLLPPPPAISVWHDSDDDEGDAKEEDITEQSGSSAKRARGDAAQPPARPPLIQKQHSLPNTLAARNVNVGKMSSMAATGLAPRAAQNGVPFGGMPLGAASRSTLGGKVAPAVPTSQRQTTLAWRTSSAALVAPTVVDLSEL